jgi:hypothetical protein
MFPHVMFFGLKTRRSLQTAVQALLVGDRGQRDLQWVANPKSKAHEEHSTDSGFALVTCKDKQKA